MAIKDDKDLRWHEQLLKVSLKQRDEAHRETDLWGIFDLQAKRIYGDIDAYLAAKEKTDGCCKPKGDSKKCGGVCPKSGKPCKKKSKRKSRK